MRTELNEDELWWLGDKRGGVVAFSNMLNIGKILPFTKPGKRRLKPFRRILVLQKKGKNKDRWQKKKREEHGH